jgi:hypothetical protein
METTQPSLLAVANAAGVPLMPWQRQLFERLSNLKPGERIIHMPPKRMGKTYTRELFWADFIGRLARRFA